MSSSDKLIPTTCLNCGSDKVEYYCAVCGQKAQATKQPLRVFISDTVETLFNIDSRWFQTIRDLFLKPGKVTRDYIEGKRASYLPPVRIYISISIVYFLIVELIDSNQIFFVNFGLEDGSNSELAKVIQYSLFFLVPVLALIAKLLYRKRKQFFVEHLIFSFHIHSIWLILLMFELLTVWLNKSYDYAWVSIVSEILSFPAQLGTFLYVVFNLKRLYEQGWVKTILKSLLLMTFYVVALIGVVAVYALIYLDL